MVECRTVWLVAMLVPGWVAAAERNPATKHSAQSDNFRVIATSAEHGSAEFLADCERLRTELQSQWLAEVDPSTWRPRCQIVVHSNRASYLRAVGPEGTQTFGSSLIQFEAQRPVTRQIDLLVDQHGQLSALAHELAHVVLADRFRGRQPPRWLDEGIATMADAAEKRRLHARDCQTALRTGSALRIVDVLHLDRFTAPHQVPAFYGQSLSLVEYLANRAAPHQVVNFVETALERGYDQALRQHYDIHSIAMLEREWRRHAEQAPTVRPDAATLVRSPDTKAIGPAGSDQLQGQPDGLGNRRRTNLATAD